LLHCVRPLTKNTCCTLLGHPPSLCPCSNSLLRPRVAHSPSTKARREPCQSRVLDPILRVAGPSRGSRRKYPQCNGHVDGPPRDLVCAVCAVCAVCIVCAVCVQCVVGWANKCRAWKRQVSVSCNFRSRLITALSSLVRQLALSNESIHILLVAPLASSNESIHSLLIAHSPRLTSLFTVY
jgi:hypothetical protein